jgi:hypothetical protein
VPVFLLVERDGHRPPTSSAILAVTRSVDGDLNDAGRYGQLEQPVDLDAR